LFSQETGFLNRWCSFSFKVWIIISIFIHILDNIMVKNNCWFMNFILVWLDKIRRFRLDFNWNLKQWLIVIINIFFILCLLQVFYFFLNLGFNRMECTEGRFSRADNRCLIVLRCLSCNFTWITFSLDIFNVINSIWW